MLLAIVVAFFAAGSAQAGVITSTSDSIATSDSYRGGAGQYAGGAGQGEKPLAPVVDVVQLMRQRADGLVSGGTSATSVSSPSFAGAHASALNVEQFDISVSGLSSKLIGEYRLRIPMPPTSELLRPPRTQA